MLGYDVYQVANEGKMVCVVPAEQAQAALDAMHANPYGVDAAIIGEVVEKPEERSSRVSIRTGFGALRIMDMLVGEQLPRICQDAAACLQGCGCFLLGYECVRVCLLERKCLQLYLFGFECL